MQKIKSFIDIENKKGRILLIMLVILTIIFCSGFVFAQQPYEKIIVVDNTANSNSLTNYSVLLNLDTQSLISAGEMRSDCGDIRIKDSDRTTSLSYWIEPSTCNTTETKIWIKVPSIPASSKKFIYLEHGDLSLTSQSNVSVVFIEDIPGLIGAWHFDENVSGLSETSIEARTVYDSSGNGNNGLFKDNNNPNAKEVYSTNGLQVWWKLNDSDVSYGAIVKDYSGKGHDGEIGSFYGNRGNTYINFSNYGYFDGSFYSRNDGTGESNVPVYKNSLGTNLTQYSFEIWAWDGDYGTSMRLVNLFGGGSLYREGAINWRWLFNGQIYDLSSVGYPYKSKRWHYYAVVFDHGNVSFYLDGVKVKNYTMDLPHSAGDIKIELSNVWQRWHGYLDSFRFYNRTLTDTEIKRNYLTFPKRIQGKYGSGLEFGSEGMGRDEYVDFGNPSNLYNADNLSVVAWVRYDTGVYYESWPFIHGTWQGAGWWLWSACFGVRTDVTSYSAGNCGDTPVTSGWVLRAGTYAKNDSIVSYYNTNPTTKAIEGTMIQPNNILKIPYDLRYRGAVDELFIFNITLSQSQINNFYNYYAYTTLNYPHHALIRQRSDPEPTTRVVSFDVTAISPSDGERIYTTKIDLVCNANATEINENIANLSVYVYNSDYEDVFNDTATPSTNTTDFTYNFTFDVPYYDNFTYKCLGYTETGINNYDEKSFKVFQTTSTTTQTQNYSDIIAGILILLATIAIFLFFSFNLGDEHEGLKFFLFLFIFFFVIVLSYLGYYIVTNEGMQNFAGLYSNSIWIAIFIIAYFIIYFIYRTVLNIKTKYIQKW